MGIKFRCPNGHKLNVKSFLAGKKGICPHCGTKFVIPDEAEQDDAEDVMGQDVADVGGVALAIGAPAKSVTDTVAFQPVIAKPTGSSLGDVTVAASPAIKSVSVVTAAAPTIPIGVAVAPVVPDDPIPVQQPVAVPITPVQTPAAVPVGIVPVAIPTSPVTPVIPSMANDPIAEAPNAVWYVRPPSGGQFGPARGDIMRKWLGEGRVSADSLVWRDGWTDWKSAAIVFPQLAPVSAAAPAGDLLIATPGVGTPKSTTSRTPRGRRKSQSLAVVMVVVLGLISVALVGLLAFVLMGGLGET